MNQSVSAGTTGDWTGLFGGRSIPPPSRMLPAPSSNWKRAPGAPFDFMSPVRMYDLPARTWTGKA